jgi:hypothetical protein
MCRRARARAHARHLFPRQTVTKTGHRDVDELPSEAPRQHTVHPFASFSPPARPPPPRPYSHYPQLHDHFREVRARRASASRAHRALLLSSSLSQGELAGRWGEGVNGGNRCSWPSPPPTVDGEKAADTFYRRSQLRLARCSTAGVRDGRGGKKRGRDEGWLPGAIRAPRQKPPRGTNGRLSFQYPSPPVGASFSPLSLRSSPEAARGARKSVGGGLLD